MVLCLVRPPSISISFHSFHFFPRRNSCWMFGPLERYSSSAESQSQVLGSQQVFEVDGLLLLVRMAHESPSSSSLSLSFFFHFFGVPTSHLQLISKGWIRKQRVELVCEEGPSFMGELYLFSPPYIPFNSIRISISPLADDQRKVSTLLPFHSAHCHKITSWINQRVTLDSYQACNKSTQAQPPPENLLPSSWKIFPFSTREESWLILGEGT